MTLFYILLIFVCYLSPYQQTGHGASNTEETYFSLWCSAMASSKAVRRKWEGRGSLGSLLPRPTGTGLSADHTPSVPVFSWSNARIGWEDGSPSKRTRGVLNRFPLGQTGRQLTLPGEIGRELPHFLPGHYLQDVFALVRVFGIQDVEPDLIQGGASPHPITTLQAFLPECEGKWTVAWLSLSVLPGSCLPAGLPPPRTPLLRFCL